MAIEKPALLCYQSVNCFRKNMSFDIQASNLARMAVAVAAFGLSAALAGCKQQQDHVAATAPVKAPHSLVAKPSASQQQPVLETVSTTTTTTDQGTWVSLSQHVANDPSQLVVGLQDKNALGSGNDIDVNITLDTSADMKSDTMTVLVSGPETSQVAYTLKDGTLTASDTDDAPLDNATLMPDGITAKFVTLHDAVANDHFGTGTQIPADIVKAAGDAVPKTVVKAITARLGAST